MRGPLPAPNAPTNLFEDKDLIIFLHHKTVLLCNCSGSGGPVVLLLFCMGD